MAAAPRQLKLSHIVIKEDNNRVKKKENEMNRKCTMCCSSRTQKETSKSKDGTVQKKTVQDVGIYYTVAKEGGL